MPKLVIIIVGLVFALIGYKKTWYPGWALLFNLFISIYLGIMTAPQVVDKFPAIRDCLGDYSYATFILLMVFGVFTVLQLITFRFFTVVYVVSFPKILNSVGAAVLGFLTGAAAAGFLLFLVTITPLSDFSAVKFVVQDSQVPGRVNYALLGSCNFVHDISLQADPTAVDKQMEKILTGWRHIESVQLIQPPVNKDKAAKPQAVSDEPNT